MTQFLKKHALSILYLIIGTVATVALVAEYGFGATAILYHIWGTSFCFAYALTIASYYWETRNKNFIRLKKTELIISILTCIFLTIIGFFYWNKTAWILVTGLTVIFYLVLFGFSFIMRLLKI